jgi:immune inhibitor A
VTGNPVISTETNPIETHLSSPEMDRAYDTLNTIKNEIIPVRDLNSIVSKLRGIHIESSFMPLSAVDRIVGETQTFYATNDDTDEELTIQATLRYATPHLYFWIENGVKYDSGDMKDLCDTFEKEIYPINRDFFGSEWSPGIDGDVHLYILYARNLGSNIAGYFSSVDEMAITIDPTSNMHEMFYLSTSEPLGSPYTYGVLAHEFQHMIHWYRDKNEDSWMNEGLSDLASFINGYDAGGFDYYYLRNPDIPMRDWPEDLALSDPYYGAAYLFIQYFYEQFGEKATKDLVSEQKNGFDSIDASLQAINASNAFTGAPENADDVFADWTLANYLNAPSMFDGRYGYHSYQLTTTAQPTEVIYDCPMQKSSRQVNQYGTDYIQIKCRGSYDFLFSGKATVPIVSTDAHSGNYFFWSNQSDDSDTTMHGSFDFTDISSPIEMNFWVSYDIEDDFDYVYLEVKPENGQWQVVSTPYCREEKNGLGCGYTGTSSGWVEQSVDLSIYAGQTVEIQFEYITDAGVVYEGFMVDDISIPVIGYFENFESGMGKWQSEGFVRIDNALPQTFNLTVIREGSVPSVEHMIAQVGGDTLITIEIGNDYNSVVIVISGTARHTQKTATYEITINEN